MSVTSFAIDFPRLDDVGCQTVTMHLAAIAVAGFFDE